MKAYELLIELETFVSNNQDDFFSGKGTILIEQFINEWKQNASIYIEYINDLNNDKCQCGEVYHKFIKLSTMQYKFCPECGIKL